ncbi:hypothetical protein [Legionella nagasakiensis]|uniref:hypothetical protein n=1 Tax=Legionella nagasakiensis TaxID=535290 RepID=UPI001055B9CA|nr:hypothetical protein [Legionella nagasakiensis]
MNRRLTMSLLLIVSLFISTNTYAANDNKIIQWTQNTLLSTLSVSYQENKQHDEFVQSNYTYNARQALHEFLGGYMVVIKNKQLTLHPQLNGPAEVLEAGIVKNSTFFDGIHYWRIHQAVLIPELNQNIEFTIVVIETLQKNYLIQALDMTLH